MNINDIWYKRAISANQKHNAQLYHFNVAKRIIENHSPSSVLAYMFSSTVTKKDFSCAASFLERIPFELINLRKVNVQGTFERQGNKWICKISELPDAVLSDFYGSYKNYIKFLFEAFGVKCTITPSLHMYQHYVIFEIPFGFEKTMLETCNKGLVNEKTNKRTPTKTPVVELSSDFSAVQTVPTTSTKERINELVEEVKMSKLETVSDYDTEINKLQLQLSKLTQEREAKKKNEVKVLIDDFVDKITWFSGYKKRILSEYLLKELMQK